MTRCYTHDVEYPSQSECPVCRADEAAENIRATRETQEEANRDSQAWREEEAERQAERDTEREEERERRDEAAREREEERERERERRHEEIVEERRRASHKEANPGDYECPECRYVTLLRSATRCPKCRAVVDPSYWSPIFEREKKQAEDRERARSRPPAILRWDRPWSVFCIPKTNGKRTFERIWA